MNLTRHGISITGGISIGLPARVGLGGGGAAPNDFLNGLMGHWKGDEASGNAIDAHVLGLDLTDTNTVTTNTGLIYPTVRQFTAANSERFLRSAESLLKGGDFDFTFATWFYADSLNGGTGRTVGVDTGGAFWLSLSNFVANRLTWSVFNTSNAAFSATFATDIVLSGWYSAIGSYRASDKQVALKVNGNAPVTATLTGTPRTAGTEFNLGFSAARYFDGRICPAAFWTRLLTDEEKTQWYNNGAGFAFANWKYLTPVQRDVWVIAGQSNASGRGTNNQVYSHASIIPLNFANDYRIKKLVDPLDTNTGQIDAVSSEAGGAAAAAGSCWPLLATQLMAENGHVPVFVPCAKGGTSITSWLPGADHADRTTLYGSMIYRARQAMAYGTLRCVLWWQGETDAEAGMSQATYNGHLDTIANAVMADLGVPIMPCKLQNSSIITDGLEAAINAAIAEAWGDNANVKTGPDFSDITSDDDYHFKTDAHLLTAADRWFVAIDAAGII